MSFEIPAHVIKNRRTTLERAEKLISSSYFTDVNLRGKQRQKTAPLTSLGHYAAPERISYEQATHATYTEVKVGTEYGPLWSTHWFRLVIDIPRAWLGEEVHLLWDSGSEAMVWRDGKPIQGLTHEKKRDYFRLTSNLTEDELRHEIYIEMACTGLFGAGEGSLIAPPNINKKFTLSKACVAVVDPDLQMLLLDFEVLIDLIRHLPENSNRGYQALFTVNNMVNVTVPDDKATYAKAREIARTFLSQQNGASQHTISAVGNCHIDTAWLWPYAETIRKCARSWSTSIRLLQKYPHFTFAASQAQQFEWVKETYPELFQEIKDLVKAGRFIPVGGTWVEMDGNIPSGESFIRQFLYGQRFFEKEFGIRCKEFWLPDTFGYSAQLPQILQLCGIHRFVTQKISWNLVNKFPHHTFWWKGIDGSSVLTHFPPGDSYGMEGKVEELMHTVNNYREKGRCNRSLYLYGFGDGGQGPTEEMVEKLTRLKDTDGCPKVEFTTPSEFFQNLEDHEGGNLCTWIGELYLELHNATYTTHAKVKENNRKCEFLLRNAEMISALSWCLGCHGNNAARYPCEELLRLWRLLLLNQFHDVLPGTSIQQVYTDAAEYYEDIRNSGSEILKKALSRLLQHGNKKTEGNSVERVAVNTLSWERSEVVQVTDITHDAPPAKKHKTLQTDSQGHNLVLVKTVGCGHSRLVQEENFTPVTVTMDKTKDLIYLDNGLVRAAFDAEGRITELYKVGHKKNAVPCGKHGNQFVIFDDIPLYWDAWDVMDYHLETRKPVRQLKQHAVVVDDGPLRAAIKVLLNISDRSSIRQTIILDAGSPYLRFENEVTWHESHRFLKVEFPLDIISMQATYEIQFGHLQRPVHQNTSWDWARFEVCGHKWADFSQHDFGVAVLNDCKYGYSTIGNVMRLSLLRSSKSPDPEADMGEHRFTYAVMPHTGSFQEAGVIRAAYELNCPLLVEEVAMTTANLTDVSYFSIDSSAVILDTVKQSEDGTGLVLRMFEAFGSHTEAAVCIRLPGISSVHIVNALEDVLEKDISFRNSQIKLTFEPFQIKTVLLNMS